MTQIQKNKEYLEVLEGEFLHFPALFVQLMGVLRLDDAQASNLDSAQWRSAFRMILLKYILEALLSRNRFGKVEIAAADLGETVFSVVRQRVNTLIEEMFKIATKNA